MQEGYRGMGNQRVAQGVMVTVIVGVLLAGAGCGTSSKSEAPAPPTPPEVVAPPPSLRDAGAKIADEAMLKQLVPGKTTKAEVQERFGVPQEVVVSPGGETFIYFRDRTSGWFSRSTRRVESLTVRFDDQGLLKDFEYRFAGK